MSWYRIRVHTNEQQQSIQKTLVNQNYKVWQYGNAKHKYLITLVGNGHSKWLGEVCAAFNTKASEITAPPSSLKGAAKTIEAERNLADRKDIAKRLGWSEVTTVAKIEPHTELTFDGVITSLEAYRDQLWQKLEQLDSLVCNLKAWRDGKAQLAQLEAEYQQRIAAVRLVLDGGPNV